VSKSNTFRIYPNPAKDKVYVSLMSRENLNSSIQILNLIGEMMFETVMTDVSVGLDVTSYPSGIYFVKLTAKDNSSKMLKFIKN